MQYKLSLEAEEDLIRIYRYGLKKFGESQEIKYYMGLVENFAIIAKNPYQLPSAEHVKKDYRYCTYKADTIYYRISGEVEIMAIVGRQDFGRNSY